MIEGGIYVWAVLVVRTVAGFFVGLFLGIFSGWLALIFNAMIGYPWDLDLHTNIYFVSIGLGAGLGAYFGWMNLTLRWYLIAGSLLLVLIGGLAGTYIGLIYGQYVEPTYMGRQYTIDNSLHFGAGIGGITVSTALGLLNGIRTQGR
jgi:MFS family permease